MPRARIIVPRSRTTRFARTAYTVPGYLRTIRRSARTAKFGASRRRTYRYARRGARRIGSSRRTVVNRRRIARALMNAASSRVKQCAKDWLVSLLNPFSGPLACNPALPATFSERARYFVRVTPATSGEGVVFNSNGDGLVIMRACPASGTAADPELWDTTWSLYFSSGTQFLPSFWMGESIENLTISAAHSELFPLNSPYVFEDFGQVC